MLSTATIALALFVLGGFLMVTANLERLGAEWSRAAELSVYLKDDVTRGTAARHRSGARAGRRRRGARVRVEGRGARRASSRRSPIWPPALDSVGDNPLPASFDVRLTPGRGARLGVDCLAARLRQLPGVADVRYDRQWLDRLLSAIARHPRRRIRCSARC